LGRSPIPSQTRTPLDTSRVENTRAAFVGRQPRTFRYCSAVAILIARRPATFGVFTSWNGLKSRYPSETAMVNMAARTTLDCRMTFADRPASSSAVK
jgi:hypothetical protein